MAQRNPAVDHEIALIKKTFATSEGRELLQLWTKYHVMGTIADANPTVMAYRAGKLEFVTAILNCIDGE